MGGGHLMTIDFLSGGGWTREDMVREVTKRALGDKRKYPRCECEFGHYFHQPNHCLHKGWKPYPIWQLSSYDNLQAWKLLCRDCWKEEQRQRERNAHL